MLKTALYVAFVANILLIVSASNKHVSPQRSTKKKPANLKPPRCGELEVPDACYNGGCYKEKNCSHIIRPYICVDVIECIPGCACKAGYLKNEKGDCIPKNECPEKLRCPRQNEVYNPCVDKCYPDTCESIDKQYNCPYQGADKKCTGGCVCEPGYYKNKIGDCIAEENCRKCTGPNEFYSCGGACDNICETLSVQNQTNCPIINIKCNEMCYCEEGYARNGNGTCVPFDQCPGKAPTCGKNEIYSNCTNGGCFGATKCEEVGKAGIRCVKIDPKNCIKGCKCINGYVRDKKGACIPKDQCPKKPPTCGKNEIYSNCTNGGCFGATKCEEVGKAGIRCVKIDPKNCIKGCKCINGYVRDKKGACIPKDQCPKKSPTCGKNEIYSNCTNGGCFGATKCEEVGKAGIRCVKIDPKNCIKGCKCVNGYVRNKKGACIPKDQCPKKPPTCGTNEIYSNCTNGGCFGARTCKEVGQVGIKCVKIDPKNCIKGCLCRDGYVKDKNNKCILEDQCPNTTPTCGTNEIYSDCTNGGCFGARTCEEVGKVGYVCVRIDPKNCIKGCICKDSYVKGKNGACISEDQCPQKPPTCKSNEIYSNCTNGGCFGARTCEEVGKVGVKCVKIDPKNCIKGCLCRDGYVKDKNDRCIPENKCPVKPPTCGTNEIYSNCTNGGCFGARTCKEVGQVGIKCVKIDPKNCIKGCLCRDGYVKDKNNICILEDQCPNTPPTCGTNEIYSDCTNGGCFGARTCEEVGKVGYVCVRIDPKNCIKGCICKDGYVKGKNGACISEDQCPQKPPTCRSNEIYSNCTNGGCFGARTCEEVGKVGIKCVKIDPKNCIKGCLCRDGYVKDKNDRCILENECPVKAPTCGTNQIYSDCTNGGCFGARTCEEVGKVGIKCVKIDPKNCIKGCLCRDGYVKDKNDRCILENECPVKHPTCGTNEIYSDCTNGGCFGARTCEEVGKVGYRCVRIDPNNCIKGCICSDGYVKGKNGTCISEDQCPQKPKCGKNEELIKCPALYCKPRTCEQKGTKPPCPRISSGLPCPGSPGCECKSGYLRGPNGNCIPESQCPPTCGINQIYSNCTNGGCFGAKNCDEVGHVGIKCVKIDPKDCIKGCQCITGHVKSENGTCISEEQCPELTIKCGKFEVADSCANGGCYDERKCSDIGNPTICIRPIKCEQGCLCKPGYLRDKQGRCIKREQCPNLKCTGPNEYYDCGGACDNICETLSIRNQTNCDIINVKCNEMCYCDEGYARNGNGTCVPFDQCPGKAPKCGKLEVADPCINGGCYDERECTDIGNPTICARPTKCTPGCLCKPGYLRDQRGRCIKRENCPNLKCTGPNEYYDCGVACDNICETLSIRNQTNCDIINVQCNEMCYCEEGYARNGNGTCVPFDQCPGKAPKCGKYEVADSCVNGGCYDERKCSDIGNPTICARPIKCEQGCLCKPGYLRDQRGHCIKREQCPNLKCTGPNEFYDCGVACDNICETLSIRNQTNCDIINVKCNEMCYCEEGYARNGNGTCVPFDQCPGKAPKCGKYEVADSCVYGGCYDERECTDIGKPTKCARPIKCTQGCLCKPGYLRDQWGRCIKREQCPNFGESDESESKEEYSSEENNSSEENIRWESKKYSSSKYEKYEESNEESEEKSRSTIRVYKKKSYK